MNNDCLILGFYDSSFPSYVDMVRSMGADSGAFRDLSLAFVEHEGKPMRSMDMLNHFYFEGKDTDERFHNSDFLWPTITYLGTHLHRNGLSFDYINLPHLNRELLIDKLRAGNPMTVAITTTLYVSPHPIIELIELIRAHNTHTKILVGGPYIYNQSKMLDPAKLLELFEFMGADIYVVNQAGESTLVSLLRALKEDADLEAVDNIAFRRQGTYQTTKRSVEDNPIDNNIIDYDLFAREDIGQFVSLATAKSCPFACAFCGFPERAGKYRYLSVEHVEHELDRLRELGVSTVTFLDDTFNVPKRRFKEILEMMIRKQYGFRWNSFYRSDHGSEEIIALMAEAGCEGVFLGVESGSDRMLQEMNKAARRKHYMPAIPMLRKYGIATQANFIIGFPGETYDSVMETVELIETTRPDFYRAQLWYADPVTPIWRRRLELGIKGSSFQWSHATMDHRTAADLVDRMFLCIENSVWLPQNGFEQWSTFYLQRKGMTLDRIKEFLRYFNAAIKDRLTHPGRGSIPEPLLAGMARAARFDRDQPPARETEAALALYGGARYCAAERAVAEMFAGEAPRSVLDELRGQGPATATTTTDTAAPGKDDWSVVELHHGGAGKDDLLAHGRERGLDARTVLLGAFGVLLSRLSGNERIALVAAAPDQDGQALVPLQLTPAWRTTFADYLESVRDAWAGMREHATHALAVAQNRLRLGHLGASSPRFEIAFQLIDAQGQDQGEHQGLGRMLSWHPGLAEQVELTLEVRATAAGHDLRLAHGPGIARDAVQHIAEYLGQILHMDSDAFERTIGELAIEQRAEQAHIEADAAEAFNF